ncbi:MAG: hypothetical protein U0264_00310 [Candidatus Kapaibacterium sp.]
MKLHLTIASILIMMACTSQNLLASEPRIYINPGVKFGYSFGEKGGFTYGLDVSITSTFTDSFSPFWAGIVFTTNKRKGKHSIHYGVQASYLGFGMEVGPTYVNDYGKMYSGYSVTTFGGFVIIPYYTYSRFDKDSLTNHEIGTYVKMPILIMGESFRF